MFFCTRRCLTRIMTEWHLYPASKSCTQSSVNLSPVCALYACVCMRVHHSSRWFNIFALTFICIFAFDQLIHSHAMYVIPIACVTAEKPPARATCVMPLLRFSVSDLVAIFGAVSVLGAIFWVGSALGAVFGGWFLCVFFGWARRRRGRGRGARAGSRRLGHHHV